VLLGFARFARTLLAAIASKAQAAGRDFARLLAVGLPLRMTLLVCSQGNRWSQSEELSSSFHGKIKLLPPYE
jgi:hypothetical protein